MLQTLEAREVPAVNFWIGTSDDFDVPTFWTDGIPTSDDIIVLNGTPGPISTTIDGDGSPTSPPPSGPQPYSLSNLTFPEVGDENYEPAYAGIRIINGYGGVVTFPANVDFGEYKQTTGSTAQFADTALTVTSSFLWTGGVVNATGNVATYNIIGAAGQIGEDTTNLSSGSKFVISGGATVTQTGVLTLLNGAGIDVLASSTLIQRQITADPPPTAGFEIDGSGNVTVWGRFVSEGGKVPSVKVEPGGLLDVERKNNKGGLTVTGKVPGSNWGVVSRGAIFLRNGETLTADHGVAVTDGAFYSYSAFQIAQVATIDGRFSFEGTEIRLGLLNFMEDGTKLGHSNTTLKVTKRTDLLLGDFKPKLDVNNANARDFIKTDTEFNCEPEFFIKPEAAAPAAGTHVLVSENGFLTSNNPSNGDPTNFTMTRTNDGKKFEVK